MSPLCFERIHHALSPCNLNTEKPTDVIRYFHYFDYKEEVMCKLRDVPSIDSDGAILMAFPGLARETLE